MGVAERSVSRGGTYLEAEGRKKLLLLQRSQRSNKFTLTHTFAIINFLLLSPLVLLVSLYSPAILVCSDILYMTHTPVNSKWILKEITETQASAVNSVQIVRICVHQNNVCLALIYDFSDLCWWVSPFALTQKKDNHRVSLTWRTTC